MTTVLFCGPCGLLPIQSLVVCINEFSRAPCISGKIGCDYLDVTPKSHQLTGDEYGLPLPYGEAQRRPNQFLFVAVCTPYTWTESMENQYFARTSTLGRNVLTQIYAEKGLSGNGLIIMMIM